MEHGASVKELGIEPEAAALAGERAPIINAARVIEEQRRFGVPNELCYFPPELAIRNAYPPRLCSILYCFRMRRLEP